MLSNLRKNATLLFWIIAIVFALSFGFGLGVYVTRVGGRSGLAKGVAMEVNGVEIPLWLFNTDYNSRVAYFTRVYRENFTLPMQKMVAQDVIRDFVDQALLVEYAKKHGIKVTKDDVETAFTDQKMSFVEAVKRQILTTEGTKALEVYTDEKIEQMFNEAVIDKFGSIDRFKKALELNLYAQKAKDKILEGIEVTDEEAKKYYEENKDVYKEPAKVHVRHILVKSEATAEAIIKALKNGASFENLAKEFSQDPGTKDRGGDLGWVAKGTTVAPFDEAIFSMKKGEIRKVKTPYGIHIVQVVEGPKPERQKTFDEVKDEIRKMLRWRKEAKRLENFLEAAKATAEVKIWIHPEIFKLAPAYATPEEAGASTPEATGETSKEATTE